MHTTDWSAYWRPVEILRQTELNVALSQLRIAWEQYIRSGFEWELIQPYCFSYFTLLDALLALSEFPTDPRYRRALATVAGFENFSVVESKTAYVPNAAATSTTRNPVYLLARLKWPTVPHSTRFLPLIALANTPDFDLFGHYRRYSVSETGDLSVMVYPKNVPGGDTASLSSLGRLIRALGSSTDPFATDRADRLWQHVIQPLVMQKIGAGDLKSVEIADIGSSTGAVVGKIVANLITAAKRASAPRLRISLIDSSPSLLSEEFSKPQVRDHLENVEMIESDYHEWLDTISSRPLEGGVLRIAFACKVFDMASSFEIMTFRDRQLPSPPTEPVWFDEEGRAVTSALTSSSGPYDRLLVSSQRFATTEGHVFAQPALSGYFQMLRQIYANALGQQEGLQLPVRVFDPSTLVTSRGASAVEAVLRGYDYLVIEDADLRPSDLIRHLEALDSRDVSAIELTATMRLNGNYAYVLWKKRVTAPNLHGERLM